jgi:hypothetical protein
MYIIPLFIFTIVYRFFNKMNWMAALTTTITAFSVGIILMVIVIISLGKPLDKTIVTMAIKVGFVAENSSDETISEDFEEEIIFSEQELLSPEVKMALGKQKKEEGYKKRSFHFISLKKANGVIGYKIRLVKINGKVFEGILSDIESGQLIIEHRLYGGVATTPIAMNSVKKLEVYR